MSWLLAVIAPLVVALLAAHIDREGGAIARGLIRAAVFVLPPGERADQYDEWIDHVHAAGDRGIRPILAAASIALAAAPVIALLARYDARRRRSDGRGSKGGQTGAQELEIRLVDGSTVLTREAVEIEPGMYAIPTYVLHELGHRADDIDSIELGHHQTR